MKMSLPRDLSDDVRTTDDQAMMSDVDSNIADFKTEYGMLARSYSELSDYKHSVYLTIKKVISARGDLIENLGYEALQMYPDMKSVSILKDIAKLSPEHPLLKIWERYKGPITSLDKKVSELFIEYKNCFEEEQSLSDQMTDAEISYNDKQAKTGQDFTEAKDIIQDLAPTNPIKTDDAEIIEAVSALDLIDEESALMVTEQLAEMIQPDQVKTLDKTLAEEKKPMNKKLVYGGLAALIYWLVG